MTRYLIRGYADPFKELTPLDAIRNKKIGQNSGNLIFVASVLRNILLDDTGYDFLSLSDDSSAYAKYINSSYDHLILPFANAFRPGFAIHLDKYSELIEKLNIPVSVIGIGAQATLDYDWKQLDSISSNVKRFVSAVLDRSPTIGVRGELTREYLKSLGFSEVVTIGCPSMYMNGNELSVDVPEIITSHSRIALNLTPRVPMPPKFSARVLQEFPRATYIAQDQADLEMMLGGAPVNGESDYPGSLSSIYFRKNKGLMYLNAQHWIE